MHVPSEALPRWGWARGLNEAFPHWAVLLRGASAREAGLDIARLQPQGDDAVRVWIEDAPASDVYAWIIAAQRDHGLSVREASLASRSGDGTIAVEITFSSGGA